MHDPTLRAARTADLDAPLAMQAFALRGLGARFHDREVMEAALVHMGTMGPALITEGTNFLAERAGRILGSAGRSRRVPNYARLMASAPPPLTGWNGPAATVRSVFVHPDAVRRGIGTRLMRHVEAAMGAEGIALSELMATLSGVPLYRALGYRMLSPHEVLLPDGLRFAVRRMVRPLVERVAPDAFAEAA